MDSNHLVYLYCVTAQPPDVEAAEDQPGELYVVGESGLHAVVSRVEADEFEGVNLRRNLEDLSWVAAETMEHERIVETIMRRQCVIPFRFATLFKTDESLRRRLHEHSGHFQTLLEQLDGKTEWGVKVYCDPARLREGACAQDSEISALDEAIASAAAGKAFLLRKKREELARAALVVRMDQCAERVVEAFQRVSFQTRINKVPPPQAPDKRGAMILNSAFLVGEQDAHGFLRIAESLNECYTGESVVECSGPWPPYNFCDSVPRASCP